MAQLSKKLAAELKKLEEPAAMIPFIEVVQARFKSADPTPLQKLSTQLPLATETSYESYMQQIRESFGVASQTQLYGSEVDLWVPQPPPDIVYNDEVMLEYRKCHEINWSLPGTVERINPNKFLRLKPVEEFDLLPILPVEPARWTKYQTERVKQRQVLQSRLDSQRLIVLGMSGFSLMAFCVLMKFLFWSGEQSAYKVEVEKTRRAAEGRRQV